MLLETNGKDRGYNLSLGSALYDPNNLGHENVGCVQAKT